MIERVRNGIAIVDPHGPDRDPLVVTGEGGEMPDDRMMVFAIGDAYVYVTRSDAEAIAEFIALSYRPPMFPDRYPNYED